MFRPPRRSIAVLLTLVLAVPLVGAISTPTQGPGSSVPGDVIETGFLDDLQDRPDAVADALIVFEGTPVEEDLRRLAGVGLDVREVYLSFGTVHAVGPAHSVTAASHLPGVVGIYENEALEMHLDTATRAIEARQLWDQMSTSTPVTVDGQRLDGTGVGVAVVDSGIDGEHPDLASKTVQNLRYACSTPVLIETSTGHDKCAGNHFAHAVLNGTADESCHDHAWTQMGNTDIDSGHGTHVAGIVAGDGTASDGRFQGVAPGASLYGLAIGHGASVLIHEALAAFDHVLCIHDEVDPPIRIVQNSWGGSGAFDDENPVNIATDALIDAGLVVVWSAGNDGSGEDNTVNAYARNPTPGVISVANYDDADNASVQGTVASSSSRCLQDEETASACPDVAAPGTAIVSARASTGPVTTAIGHPLSGDSRYLCCSISTLDHSPYYVGVSGTSMAAPAVSGAIALMLQANPDLTPADVEDILEDNAWQFDSATFDLQDPDNPTTLLSTTAGHGLINATAAIEDSRVLGSSGLGTDLPKMSLQPHVYTGGVDGQLVSGVQWTVPAGEQVRLSERLLESGDPANTNLTTEVPCRFLVDGQPQTCQPDTMTNDSTGVRMDTNHTFTPGEHRVEAQLDLGDGWISFDAFTVRAR